MPALLVGMFLFLLIRKLLELGGLRPGLGLLPKPDISIQLDRRETSAEITYGMPKNKLRRAMPDEELSLPPSS
jgi:hypothetical protein